MNETNYASCPKCGGSAQSHVNLHALHHGTHYGLHQLVSKHGNPIWGAISLGCALLAYACGTQFKCQKCSHAFTKVF